jgi:chromosome partitioning protein
VFEPADADPARAVRAELERNGLTVGQSAPEWRTEATAAALTQQIAEMRVVVALLSPAAEASAWFRRELAAALNNGRLVLPVTVADLPQGSWLGAALDLADAIDMRGGPHAEALSRIVAHAQTARGGGRVITMLNVKGGVGKTVLAANVFAAAHLADKRSVSFVDLDPQHNLTQYFLAPSERLRIRERNHTLYGVLIAHGAASLPRTDLAAVAAPLNRSKRADAKFELLPGDERLFEFTMDLRSEREKAEAFARFRTLIAALRARSDAVVIDASPSATFLTRLAIASADHIVAPVRPEKYALASLNMLEQLVRQVRGRPLKPSEFSVLLNGVNDRTRSSETGDLDARTRAELHEAPFFSSAVLSEEIPYSAALKSAPSERLAANPIAVTAMMRVGGRPAKEALTRAAAAILRRAGS